MAQLDEERDNRKKLSQQARFPLCDGLVDLNTIDLSSPTGVGSARYARLAYTSITSETIINHD
jgi:hypothetical protein